MNKEIKINKSESLLFLNFSIKYEIHDKLSFEILIFESFKIIKHFNKLPGVSKKSFHP